MKIPTSKVSKRLRPIAEEERQKLILECGPRGIFAPDLGKRISERIRTDGIAIDDVIEEVGYKEAKGLLRSCKRVLDITPLLFKGHEWRKLKLMSGNTPVGNNIWMPDHLLAVAHIDSRFKQMVKHEGEVRASVEKMREFIAHDVYKMLVENPEMGLLEALDLFEAAVGGVVAPAWVETTEEEPVPF